MSTPAEPLSAYDVAGHYDEAYYGDLLDRYRRRTRFARRRLQNVLGLLPPIAGRTLLDIGCGMGTFTIEAARRGARAFGADLAPAALAAASGAAREEGVAATFLRADAAALPLRAASVDVAIAADVTEHLDHVTLERTAHELARTVRAGGILVVYTPAPSHFLERLRAAGLLRPDPSHIGMRTAAELGAAFGRHGFAVQRIEYLPSHVPGLDALERAAARVVPLLRRRIGMVLVRTDP